jgi:hypothetical protein
MHKRATYISAVLRYAASNGYVFPALSTSSNKNNRRDIVSTSESISKKTTPKVTGLLSHLNRIEEILDQPELENLPIKGNPGLNAPKDFWLFKEKPTI